MSDAPEAAQWLFGAQVVGLDLQSISDTAEESEFGDLGFDSHRKTRKKHAKPASRSGGTRAAIQRALSPDDVMTPPPTIEKGSFVNDAGIDRGSKREKAIVSRGGDGRRKKRTSAFVVNDSCDEEAPRRTSVVTLDANQDNHDAANGKWATVDISSHDGADSETFLDECTGPRRHTGSKVASSKGAQDAKKKHRVDDDETARTTTTTDALCGARRPNRKSQDKKPSVSTVGAFSSDEFVVLASDDDSAFGGRGRPPTHTMAQQPSDCEELGISNYNNSKRNHFNSTSDEKSGSKKRRAKETQQSNASLLSNRQYFANAGADSGEDASHNTSLSGTLLGRQPGMQFPPLSGNGAGGSSPPYQSIEFGDIHTGSIQNAHSGWSLASLGALPPIQAGPLLPPVSSSKHGRSAV